MKGNPHVTRWGSEVALRHLLFEANLYFVSSDDLQGQFAANRVELALGGLEPADLIRWAKASAGFRRSQ